MYCFCRGPEFGSKYPHQGTHKCLEIPTLFPALHEFPCLHSPHKQTNTPLKIKKFNKEAAMGKGLEPRTISSRSFLYLVAYGSSRAQRRSAASILNKPQRACLNPSSVVLGLAGGSFSLLTPFPVVLVLMLHLTHSTRSHLCSTNKTECFPLPNL